MRNLTQCLLPLIACFLLITGCNKDDEPQTELKITLQEPSEVTETSFLVSWIVNKSGITAAAVELAMEKEFAQIVETIVVNPPTSTSQKIEGMTGATKCYVRVKLEFDDGTSEISNVESVTTGYQTEDLNTTTIDDVSIKGKLYYLSDKSTAKPLVILMGGLTFPNIWKGEDVFLDLLVSGYACYIFNWRGHGSSGAWPMPGNDEEICEFINTHAKNDMIAAFAAVKTHPKVDSTRIALMGSSLGAAESLNGNTWTGVKASVALTAMRYCLDLQEGLKNVFYIATELDETSAGGGIDYSDEATFLYSQTEEPKKLLILPGAEHGRDMLAKSGVSEQILEWINTRMQD